jgi:hypothetical protein
MLGVHQVYHFLTTWGDAHSHSVIIIVIMFLVINKKSQIQILNENFQLFRNGCRRSNVKHSISDSKCSHQTGEELTLYPQTKILQWRKFMVLSVSQSQVNWKNTCRRKCVFLGWKLSELLNTKTYISAARGEESAFFFTKDRIIQYEFTKWKKNKIWMTLSLRNKLYSS